MDIEFERIRNIKERNGEEYNSLPHKLSDDVIRKIYEELFSNYADYSVCCKQKNIEGAIKSIINIIYLSLDGLVTAGIYPSSIIDAIVFSKISKIWNDGKLHYNDVKEIVNPSDWKHPYHDIDDAISRMELNVYDKENKNIEDVYLEIQDAYKKLNFSYSDSPCFLNYQRNSYFGNNLYNNALHLLNCDYKGEDAFYIGNILYYSLSVLVEMGVNPKNYFDALLQEKENELSKRR